MSLVLTASQCLIAAVFLVSAVGKIRLKTGVAKLRVGRIGVATLRIAKVRAADGGFAESVLGLVGLPTRIARTATIAAAAAEVVVVVLLAVGAILPSTHPWATAAGFGLALLLLLGFTAALAVALRHGVRTPCGCFGPSSDAPSTRHVVRNALLMAAAATGAITAGSVEPAALSPDSISAGVVGIVVAIAVVAGDDLVALVRPAPSPKTRRYP